MAAIEQLFPEYVTRAGNFKVSLEKSYINLLQFYFLNLTQRSFTFFGFVRDFRVSKINFFCFKNCRKFDEVPNPTYITLEDCILLVHVASKLIRFSA